MLSFQLHVKFQFKISSYKALMNKIWEHWNTVLLIKKMHCNFWIFQGSNKNFADFGFFLSVMWKSFHFPHFNFLKIPDVIYTFWSHSLWSGIISIPKHQHFKISIGQSLYKINVRNLEYCKVVILFY